MRTLDGLGLRVGEAISLDGSESPIIDADVVDRDDVADSAGVGIETRRLRGVSA
jgi:hypothetical protein